MTRLLSALRVALLCFQRGFCSALLFPDATVHVVACNRSAAWIEQACREAAECEDVDRALYDDVLTETGSGILRREGIE